MSAPSHELNMGLHALAAPLVQVQNVSKVFKSGRRTVHAVKNVSLNIQPGETFGLVGESGSGKSTLARVVLRLHPASSGEVLFDGTRLRGLDERNMRKIRQRMQIIFQDPLSSLFPHLSVWANITEPLALHSRISKQDRIRRAKELMDLVGLSSNMLYSYPHELSGGQQQRVGIARALSLKPEFIVCDEPVSALDVSIQAQILRLLETLQKEMGLTFLFIAHNLAVVESVSDHVGVMYLGKLVEMSRTADLYENPLHPYTQALLSAIPKVTAEKQGRIRLQGEVPSPLNPPAGCPFHTRCPYAEQRCREEEPVFRRVADQRFVACHLVEQV